MFPLLFIQKVHFGIKWSCLFNFWKNVGDVILKFLYLSWISILLFKMLIVGIYLVINEISTILFLRSVMLNI